MKNDVFYSKMPTNKITEMEKLLAKLTDLQFKGHNFYEGKLIRKMITQLEFEICIRKKYGNKAREAFLT